MIDFDIELGEKFTFLLIGTSEIEAWTPGKPFVQVLQSEKDFENVGANFTDCKDMKVGEAKADEDLEGIFIVRIS